MQMTVSTYAFNQDDDRYFSFLLKLSAACLSSEWRKTAVEDSQIVIVDIDQAQGREFWQNNSAKHLIAYSHWQPKDKDMFFIAKPLQEWKPVVEILNTIVERLSDGGITGTADEVPAQAALQNQQQHINPKHHFLGLLQKALHEKRTCCFSAPNHTPIYVLGKAALCFTQALDIHNPEAGEGLLCASSLDQVEYRELDIGSFWFEVREQGLTSYRSDVLLWLSALAITQGRYPENTGNNQLLSLKAWPNFTLLPYRPSYMCIAAFMAHNRASVEQIAEKTSKPIADVLNFVHGCHALGLLNTAAVSEPPVVCNKKPLTEKTQTVLSGIMRRLFHLGHVTAA